MVHVCWSVKGGSGTTVVAACLALLAASRSEGAGALLVDLAGDIPAALGSPEPVGAGVGDWLAGPSGDLASLLRLEIDVGGGVSMLPMGARPEVPGAKLLAALAGESRAVIIDAGLLTPGTSLDVISGADASLLVLRSCYLALRKAALAPARPTGVVLIEEPGRALGRKDVESVLGVPVVASVLHDATVARAVDAGLLAARMPRSLARSLRSAA